jgi:xylulokinase
MPALLGLDIGTTSTIGILIDENRTLATASRPSELISLHANWAEEEPDLWWSNVRAVIHELLETAGLAGGAVAAVGATGMVPAVVLLDREGRVLRRSMQQNDARAIPEIAAMRRRMPAARFFAATGGSINQQAVAPKLQWVAHHEPKLFGRIATVLGSYDYIVHRLTGSRGVEHNWALESGLMDFERHAFTEELVAAAGIDRSLLPPIRASHEIAGRVTAHAAAETGLATGTPVVAGSADHVASAYVAGAVAGGDLVLKFGGAGDILLATDRPVTDPRLFIDYHLVPGLYFSNGCTATAGSLLNWLVRELAGHEQAAAAAAKLSIHAWLDRLAAAVPAGADGLVLLPYFLGEKTPLHDPFARGTLVGLGLHHRLAHIWRAALEGVVFGFRHHLDVFHELGLTVRQVLACDGGASSDLWLQIAADVLGRPVRRIERHPGSCLGAAYIAGYGSGQFKDLSGVSAYVEAGRLFEPDPQRRHLYDHVYRNYRETYERLKTLYPRLDPGRPNQEDADGQGRVA